jgi:hypothetical protein
MNPYDEEEAVNPYDEEEAAPSPAVGNYTTTAMGQRGLDAGEAGDKMREMAVNRDAAYSIANVPRDLFEGTLALPKQVDDFEQYLIQQGKDQGGFLGRLATNYEALDKRIMPRFVADNLPSEEQIQENVTTPFLGKPYVSGTTTGQALRTGLNILAPAVGPVKAIGQARNAGPVRQAVDQLEAAKNDAYALAKRNAPQVWPQAYENVVQEVKKTADSLPIDRYAQAQSAVRRLEGGVQRPDPMQQKWHNAMGGPPPPKPKPVDHREVEDIRKGLLKAERGASYGSDDQFVYGELRRSLDDALKKVGADSPEYQAARHANKIFKRAEALDNLIQDARDVAKHKGTKETDEIQKALFRKLGRNSADLKWMKQFPPDVRGQMREAALRPKKMQGLLDFLAKDRAVTMGLMASYFGHATGVVVGTAFKGLSLVGKYADGKVNSLPPKMVEELQRRAQGLRQRPKAPVGRLPGPAAAAIGGASVTPGQAEPAYNPMNILPRDDDTDLTPYAAPMGIRG